MLFPALFRVDRVDAESIGLVVGESSCFFHETKKATVACSSCGRFLCGLCDVEIGGDHICPSCIDSQMQKGQLDTLERSRFLPHRLALFLAALNLFIGWCTAGIPGIIAIVFGIRALTAPASVYDNSSQVNRVVGGLSIGIAALNVLGIGIFYASLFA